MHIYRVEELRQNTLEYIDRLLNMSEAFSALQKELFDEKREEMSRTRVPVGPDGEPLVDPSDVYVDLENSAFDEVYDQDVLHQRLLLIGLVHGLEVFFKALAREGSRALGAPLGDERRFKAIKAWYESHGIDPASLTGFTLLNHLRMRVNRAKHTGQADEDGLTPGRESDALLVLPTYEEDELLSHHIDAARQFVTALTDLVKARIP